MEPNNQFIPNNPNMNPAPKSIGPAIGVMVIILVILLGGLYFLKMKRAENKPDAYQVQQNTTPNTSEQASSDEINSIEADLQATTVTDLGTEFNSINKEVSQ